MAVKTVQVVINGQTHTLTYNATTKKYEATITAPSTSSYNQNGHYYNVKVKATDEAGNSVTKDATDTTLGSSLQLKVKEKVATQKSVTFTVDTVPPELSVSAPVDNLVTNQSSLVVKGTTNDVTSSPVTLTIKLNGGTEQTVEVGSDGSFTKTLTLVTGENTIVITAKDGAGKTSTVTKKVVLDQTAPVIQSVTISPNPVNAGATYTISVEVTD